AAPPPVLRELLGHGREHFLADQGGDLDGKAVGRGRVLDSDGATGRRLCPPPRPHTGATRADLRFAEVGPALVGRLRQDPPDGRAIPVRLALGAGDRLRLEAATDCADRAALQADPGEELPHDPRVVRVDLVAGAAAAGVFADGAVTLVALLRNNATNSG